VWIENDILKHLHKKLAIEGLTFALKNGEALENGHERFKIVFHGSQPEKQFLANAQTAIAEAYMDEVIDIEGNIRELIEAFYLSPSNFMKSVPITEWLKKMAGHSVKASRENAEHHYDIGNDFYKIWLDRNMSYSCAYFKNPADDLDTTQQQKIEHSLKKLCLKPGDRLLDIGCGWGELILTAAKEYGVEAYGVTLSSEQYKKVRERIAEEGLTERVSVELADYRDMKSRGFNLISRKFTYHTFKRVDDNTLLFCEFTW
jgi:cyclopropane-fatty-acyl-phospholipid synthase